MNSRSLAAAVRTECLRTFERGARLAGATHLKGLPVKAGSTPAAQQALDVVEFDGHRLDVRLDLRTVRAFADDGAEIGVLKAQGAWREIVHDRKLRQEVVRLRGRKHFAGAMNNERLTQFIENKLAKAKRSRRGASALTQTLRALAAAPTSVSPPAPLPPTMTRRNVFSTCRRAKAARSAGRFFVGFALPTARRNGVCCKRCGTAPGLQARQRLGHRSRSAGRWCGSVQWRARRPGVHGKVSTR